MKKKEKIQRRESIVGALTTRTNIGKAGGEEEGYKVVSFHVFSPPKKNVLNSIEHLSPLTVPQKSCL